MTSRMSTARSYNRSAPVARRSASQLLTRRRVESVIALAAPALDLLLWSGEQLSRVAGRNEPPPAPVRRPDARELARIRSAP
jgi:hypothetical protein